jgi:putative ATPase
MVYAGEDPRFIFRRMLIFASEDVGLADPNALVVIEAAAAAFDRVGLPEGRFHLSQAVIYLATAPKSNSTMGFFDALKTVEEEAGAEVPTHLKDANRDAKGSGHGEGYLYPHAYRDHWVPQQYLPDSLQGTVFYEPSDQGHESALREKVLERREEQAQAAVDFVGSGAEILTFSPSNHPSQLWLLRADAATTDYARDLRDRLFAGIRLERHDRVLDLSSDSAFLALEALRRCPEGGVWSFARPVRGEAGGIQGIAFLTSGRDDVAGILAERGEGAVRFELVMGRNFVGPSSKKAATLSRLFQLLAEQGWMAFAESWPREGQRLSQSVFLPEGELAEELARAEEKVYSDSASPQTSWHPKDLEAELQACGLIETSWSQHAYSTQRVIRNSDLVRWFDIANPHSYAGRMSAYCDPSSLDGLRTALLEQVVGSEMPWRQTIVIVKGHR